MNAAQFVQDQLAAGLTVVVDGGMGTELQARGLPMDSSAWSATANLSAQDIVRSVHEEYIRAGADVIITNTYSAARPPLAAAGLANDVKRVNRGAVEAAVAARSNTASRPVAIAGSMSHVRMGTSPSEWPTREPGLLAVYREQAGLLAEAGVDLLILEMVGSTNWALPALKAATETGLPVWLGMSCDPASPDPLRPRGHPETTLEELSRALVSPRVGAIFVMHTELSQVDSALDVVFAGWTVPVGVYPNSGTFTSPDWVFGGVSPERLASEATRWVARGVQLVGGCCGTGPEHTRAVRESVTGMRPRALPSTVDSTG